MIRVLAIDPGKATGIATYVRASACSPIIWSLTILEWREVTGWVREWAPDQIHVEEFRVNSSTASKTAAPWSLKCYGALETLAFELGCRFTHAASTVKSTIKDKHLKAAGLWVGKTPHERDALRHLVLALAKMNDPWAVNVLLMQEEENK